MSTSYDLLLKRVEALTINTQFDKIATYLISDGLSMSLDEIIRVDVPLQADLLCFKYLLVFLKYLAESPKGPEYSVLSEHYVFALTIIPADCRNEVLSFMSETYLGGLCKELNTEDHLELKKWIGVYSYLKSNEVEIKLFEGTLSSKLSNILLDLMLIDHKDIKKCINCVDIALEAQKNQVDLGDNIGLLVRSIYVYLNITYELIKGGQRNDLPEVKRLVGIMKLLKLEESVKSNIKQLEDFFGSLDPAQSQERNPKKHLVKDPNLQSKQFDISGLFQKEILYANSNNPMFSVYIFLMGCPNSQDVVLKVYELKDPNYKTDRIKNEIHILETLSDLAEKSPTPTCFLRYYGSSFQKNKISLCMERVPTTLMTEISRMKLAKINFTDLEMETYARDLLQAFSTMEALNIYHQNIKPHNILITTDGKLKIVDFSFFESKSYDEGTLSATGFHFIQGYMAPELKKHALGEYKCEKIKFKRNKADVFSLGMTLLQMYTLEELYTLNFEENNQKLMKIVDQIPLVWLSTLLKNMLKFSFKDRASFKNCLKWIPGNCFPITYHQTIFAPQSPEPNQKWHEPILNENNFREINLDNYIIKDTLFANAKNPKFSVTIYLIECSGIDIVKKVYQIKDQTFNKDSIKKEINILEKLSKFQENSSIETCFLLYYGTKLEFNKISIYMQYIPSSLMDEITRMRDAGERFKENELKMFTIDLLSAFRIMNENEIYHQDIKPQNILVTKNKKLKIIDFNVSEFRSNNESTLLSTGVHYVQGTHGYMAPELQEHLFSDMKNEKIEFSRSKADVFSLGLTLLQMYTLDYVETLNFKENNSRLMSEVEKVSYHWLATLLRKMLHVDFNQRITFKKCTEIIPESITTYQNINTSSIS